MSTRAGDVTISVLYLLDQVRNGIIDNPHKVIYTYFTSVMCNGGEDAVIDQLTTIVNLFNEPDIENTIDTIVQYARQVFERDQYEKIRDAQILIYNKLRKYYGKGGKFLEIAEQDDLTMVHLAAAYGSLPLLRFLVDNCEMGSSILLERMEINPLVNDIPDDYTENVLVYWPLVISLHQIGEPTPAGYILKNPDSPQELKDYIREKFHDIEIEAIERARNATQTEDQLNLSLAVSDLLLQESERLRRRR